MKSTRLQFTLVLLSTVALSLKTNVAQAGVIGTYTSAAEVQDTSATGAKVETFDNIASGGLTAYTSTTLGGTYTSTSGTSISNGNQYGGAHNTKFITVNGTGKQYTLNLNNPQAYFGMWWSAGDGGNTFDIYSGNQLLATYKTTDVISVISQETNANAFYGNPNDPVNNKRNKNEPYAFLNFYGINGTTFDKIVFTQTTNAGFESDNHTVSALAQTITGKQFSAQYQAVPEPLTILGVGIAVGFACFFKRKLKTYSLSYPARSHDPHHQP